MIKSCWRRKPQQSPLDHARNFNVVIKSHQNLCFLDGNVEFKHPLVVLQSIKADPTYPFHDGYKSSPQVFLRVFLSITGHRFCVDPHARRESSTHPFFRLFPSLNFVHHCHSVEEHGFVCACRRVCLPRRSAKTASRRMPLCFWLFLSARGSATVSPSFLERKFHSNEK